MSYAIRYLKKSLFLSDIFISGLNCRIQFRSFSLSSNVAQKEAQNFPSVKIGNIKRDIKSPHNPELVPINYLTPNISQTILKHLKWMMQKDNLGQDIFLIGPPGSFRRSLAMMYLELTQREAEYVSLSRDTTDSDLKQRREILNGSAIYLDQAAVRAALFGRVLILEGIEKAERNVLPVLNNLLENREMQLEDGRFLMEAKRYDQLILKYSAEEMKKWNVLRCNEDFRVIALGLPVPRFRGNPLDPPLRSRFQARNTGHQPYQEAVSEYSQNYRKLDTDRLIHLISFAHVLQTEEASSLGLPEFPVDNFPRIFAILNSCPDLANSMVINRLYPYKCFLSKDGIEGVEAFLNKFNLFDQPVAKMNIDSIKNGSDSSIGEAVVKINKRNHSIKFTVGDNFSHDRTSSKFVSTPYMESQLADLLISHSVGDFAILGPRGCGKSVLAEELSRRLGYSVYPVNLYADISSRDLLQTRYTLTEEKPGFRRGDTAWRHSALVKAALEGHVALLDGLHRVNPGTLAVLHRLVTDRELDLYDGSRLLRWDRYDKMKEKMDWSDAEMNERGIHRINPRFRIIGLAEPPSPSSSTSSASGSASSSWLTPELLTTFLYHQMRPLEQQEELDVVRKLVPDAPSKMLTTLMKFVHSMRDATDPTLQSIGNSLSTRRVIQIVKNLTAYPGSSLVDSIHRACLSKFLPNLAQNALNQAIESSGMLNNKGEIEAELKELPICQRRDNRLQIGSVTVDLPKMRNELKIPDIVFYDSIQHLKVLEAMLKDWLIKDTHLLLVGNQGVGKNKIVDRFLQLMNQPREYIQLHRDTTVQSLTLQPNVRDGILVYEDSPLVKAVILGHVLVVDEADKAPTNVTCALKTLVESGQMELADGRRIVPANTQVTKSSNILVSHPDFRLIVLANRPGFPFLGNDFFGALGDVFCCHAVENPDLKSEISMLQRYGPDVPINSLEKLTEIFAELRSMADEGQIQYPYSTRELVNIVKHLQIYPSESLTNVVKNVFDFDAYNLDMQNVISDVLERHGLPLTNNPNAVNLAKEYPLPNFIQTSDWIVKKQSGNYLPINVRIVKEKPLGYMTPQLFDMNMTEIRSRNFSEQQSIWSLPLDGYTSIGDVAVARSTQDDEKDILYAVSQSPPVLYSSPVNSRKGIQLSLDEVYPRGYKPVFKIAPLPSYKNTSVLLHEALTNSLCEINVSTGELTRIETESFLQKLLRPRIWPRNELGRPSGVQMCTEWSQDMEEAYVAFYEVGGSNIEVYHIMDNNWHSIQLPFNIETLKLFDKNMWLAAAVNSNKQMVQYMIQRSGFYELTYSVREISGSENSILGHKCYVSDSNIPESLVHGLTSVRSVHNRISIDASSYCNLLVDLPNHSSDQKNDSKVKIFSCKREIPESNQEPVPSSFTQPIAATYLQSSGLLVQALDPRYVDTTLWDRTLPTADLNAFLEVIDLANSSIRYIPVHAVTDRRMSRVTIQSWIVRLGNEDILTVTQDGTVRVWQVTPSRLETALRNWRGMMDREAERELMLERDVKNADMSLSGPKEGKIDATGAPHVGGNTWMGGTGGRDTAGMGGIGGPYRLDAGHDVNQVPDSVKQAVPPHITEAARQMAKKLWKQRLKEIEMSEYDADLYNTYSQNVARQVSMIRTIVDSLQAKSKEREWLRHQNQGDLDENKLIEGLIGERAIYKRRGDKDPEPGAPQMKPKYLRLLVDVSGSMYRFNGYDKRLERQLEAVLMLMEAFSGYESKLKYDIYGHSGEGDQFSFVHADRPPTNNKQRLDVLKAMITHTQFCMSGDHTLEAVKTGVKAVENLEADERVVVLLSDANFDRYGISPKQLGRLLTENKNVFCCAVLIGSLGHQATAMAKQLPAGHAYVCLDNKGLPDIIRQIFASTILQSDVN